MRFLILFLLALTAIPAFSQAPSVPTNVTATATSGTAVTVTWTASTNPGSGTVQYRVFRDGTRVGSDSAATTFSDTGLTAGTPYSYTVSASNTAGTSAQSTAATVTTPNTPATPTGLRATAGTDGVVLTWNSVSGATEYVIFRNGTELDTSTTTTFTDTDTEVSTTYRYAVASSNSSGDSSKSTEVAVTTKGDGSQRTAVWTRAFEAVDGDFDGIVDFQEYLSGHPSAKLPETVMLYRFNSSDDDDSGDLTVDEYIAHFGGKTVKRPSKAQTFTLADVFSDIGDADGYLDIYEYALTLNRGTKEATILKKFNKLDKNHSEFLSEAEFGIKYGDTEGAPDIISSLTATAEPSAAFSYQILTTKDPDSYNAVGLPDGLTIDTTTGLISGTVATIGSYSVTISATDSTGTDTATLVIKIGLPTVNSATTASATTTAPFSYQITATNSPTTFNASNLPSGLSVDASGLISGTPTAAGTFNVVLSATNAAGSGSGALVITVTAPPSITSALTTNATVGTAFSYQIVATQSPTSFGATPLPNGLAVSPAGLISGTPAAGTGGTHNVTISATNATGTDSKTLVITISGT